MSCFVIIDGILYGSGINDHGQLGLGDKQFKKNLTPIIIPQDNESKFIAISNNGTHSIAIDNDGNLWGCGANCFGQLGLGDRESRLVFTKITSTQKYQAISCGAYHTAAIDINGFLWVCGKNIVGQMNAQLTKINDQKFNSINCAGSHTIVIDEEGYLWVCDADRTHGQLIKVNEQKFITVSSSRSHIVAIDIDGYLWSRGYNQCGQLCFKSFNSDEHQCLTRIVNLTNKFVAVSCSELQTMAIDHKGRLWWCGYYKDGCLNLCIGERGIPFRINNSLVDRIISVSATPVQTLVVDKNRSLWYREIEQENYEEKQCHHSEVFTKLSLVGTVDTLMNCPPKNKWCLTKGAHTSHHKNT